MDILQVVNHHLLYQVDNLSIGSYHAIHRLDYSNDQYGMALRSQLLAGMYGSPGGGASVYNTNYGYWAGGWNLSGPLPSPSSGVVLLTVLIMQMTLMIVFKREI